MLQNSSEIQINKRVGQYLKAKRLEAGMTQVQLAKALGRSVSFVGKYEAGGELEIRQIEIICDAIQSPPYHSQSISKIEVKAFRR